ncbi:hypothetical protein OAD67_03165 [bacterium]|nr:hypothetical protein [bacterium]
MAPEEMSSQLRAVLTQYHASHAEGGRGLSAATSGGAKVWTEFEKGEEKRETSAHL